MSYLVCVWAACQWWILDKHMSDHLCWHLYSDDEQLKIYSLYFLYYLQIYLIQLCWVIGRLFSGNKLLFLGQNNLVWFSKFKGRVKYWIYIIYECLLDTTCWCEHLIINIFLRFAMMTFWIDCQWCLFNL